MKEIEFWLTMGSKYTVLSVTSFRKIKIPSRESIFYLSASLANLGEKEGSSATLKQAIEMSDQSVEDFVQTQNHQHPEYKREFQNTLESIPV